MPVKLHRFNKPSSHVCIRQVLHLSTEDRMLRYCGFHNSKLASIIQIVIFVCIVTLMVFIEKMCKPGGPRLTLPCAGRGGGGVTASLKVATYCQIVAPGFRHRLPFSSIWPPLLFGVVDHHPLQLYFLNTKPCKLSHKTFTQEILIIPQHSKSHFTYNICINNCVLPVDSSNDDDIHLRWHRCRQTIHKVNIIVVFHSNITSPSYNEMK